MLSLSLSYIANIYFFNFSTKDRKFGTEIERSEKCVAYYYTNTPRNTTSIIYLYIGYHCALPYYLITSSVSSSHSSPNHSHTSGN